MSVLALRPWGSEMSEIRTLPACGQTRAIFPEKLPFAFEYNDTHQALDLVGMHRKLLPPP